jgi:hypothetical protein
VRGRKGGDGIAQSFLKWPQQRGAVGAGMGRFHVEKEKGGSSGATRGGGPGGQHWPETDGGRRHGQGRREERGSGCLGRYGLAEEAGPK